MQCSAVWCGAVLRCGVCCVSLCGAELWLTAHSPPLSFGAPAAAVEWSGDAVVQKYVQSQGRSSVYNQLKSVMCRWGPCAPPHLKQRVLATCIWQCIFYVPAVAQLDSFQPVGGRLRWELWGADSDSHPAAPVTAAVRSVGEDIEAETLENAVDFAMMDFGALPLPRGPDPVRLQPPVLAGVAPLLSCCAGNLGRRTRPASAPKVLACTDLECCSGSWWAQGAA